jgi:hypothetical protein
MADEAEPTRTSVSDPPPVPAALVEAIARILSAHEEVVQAKLRLRTDTFDGFEVSRKLELSLLLDDPPTDGPDPRVRSLLTAVLEPLRRQTGIGAVGVAGQAGVAAFHRAGEVVYTRA